MDSSGVEFHLGRGHVLRCSKRWGDAGKVDHDAGIVKHQVGVAREVADDLGKSVVLKHGRGGRVV